MKDKSKLLAAKSDIDAAIKKHGYASVRYVLNKKAEQFRLEKQLRTEQTALNAKIARIRSKLKESI